MDNKMSSQLTIVDADNERKSNIEKARSEYKKVTAEVEGEELIH